MDEEEEEALWGADAASGTMETNPLTDGNNNREHVSGECLMQRDFRN